MTPTSIHPVGGLSGMSSLGVVRLSHGRMGAAVVGTSSLLVLSSAMSRMKKQWLALFACDARSWWLPLEIVRFPKTW